MRAQHACVNLDTHPPAMMRAACGAAFGSMLLHMQRLAQRRARSFLPVSCRKMAACRTADWCSSNLATVRKALVREGSDMTTGIISADYQQITTRHSARQARRRGVNRVESTNKTSLRAWRRLSTQRGGMAAAGAMPLSLSS